MTSMSVVDEPAGTDVLARARTALASGQGLADVDLRACGQGELRAWGEALGRMRRELDLMLAKVASEQARRSAAQDGPAGMARRNGAPSPRGLVAGQTGGSEFDAGRLIDVGDLLGQAAQGGVPTPGAGPGPCDDSPEDGDRDDERGRGETDRDEQGPGEVARGPRFMVLSAAVEAAEVSIEAAAAISRMLTGVWEVADRAAWHRAERELAAKARLLNLRQLARVIRQVEAHLDRPGIEAREQAQHAARYLHVNEDGGGMVRVNGLLDVETAAPVKAALDALVARSLQAKRDRTSLVPDERTAPQMRADALAVLARHMIGCDESQVPRGSTTVVVRVSTPDVLDRIDAVGRGEHADGIASDAHVPDGSASIDGIAQPISAGAARRLAGDRTIVPVTLTADSAVLDLGRDSRRFTRAQRLALVERDGGCAMCGAPPSWCEAHHIREWVKHGGGTDLDNGLLLCTRCHHDLHRQGWLVDASPTQVWFTPPATIDPERRQRPGGRLLHDHLPLDDDDALVKLERAADDATGAAASRRHTRGPRKSSAHRAGGASLVCVGPAADNPPARPQSRRSSAATTPHGEKLSVVIERRLTRRGSPQDAGRSAPVHRGASGIELRAALHVGHLHFDDLHFAG